MGPEKTYETKIKRYLDNERIWYVKYFANRNTRSGIPDILACVNGYFVGIEVKAQTGHPTLLQLRNCQNIRDAGGFAFVLYPTGWEQFKEFIHELKRDEFNREMPLILR